MSLVVVSSLVNSAIKHAGIHAVTAAASSRPSRPSLRVEWTAQPPASVPDAPSPRRNGSWVLVFSLLCLLVGLAGCSALDKLRGKDFKGDEEVKSKFRPESDGELFFFDNRARQIERNLGV